ncbi:hypothetical protein SDC9_133817 [bioreactor metagenome]|uniref:Uncharacterized protein n=1 Tax=bioreactor metagenome TaxID=1076179 RepID=A0A645DBB8_9ZZZZ
MRQQPEQIDRPLAVSDQDIGAAMIVMLQIITKSPNGIVDAGPHGLTIPIAVALLQILQAA